MSTLSGHQNATRRTLSFAALLFWRGAKKSGAFNGERGIPMTPIVQVDLGAPVALSTTYIVNAQAVAGATASTQAHTSTGATYGRALSYVSSSASDTAVTVTVTGKDYLGQTQTETITLTGTNAVSGKKAFVSVSSVLPSGAMVGNLSVGTLDVLGLPYAIRGKYDVLTAWCDTTADLASATITAADDTAATAATGDPRGTYAPATATDGSKDYRIWYQIRPYPSTTYYSKDLDSQYAYGVTPA